MATQRSPSPVSRRAALAGLGAGSLGLGLVAPAQHAMAENSSLADHPLTGMWLATLPGGVAPSFFGADGTVLLAWPICEQAADGKVTYSTPAVGTWESVGERSGYFNVVQALSDDTGAFVGTRSLHGYPVVREDGRAFLDDGRKMRVYVRDGSNTLVEIRGEDGNSPEISGVRMSPGSPGFPGRTGPLAGS